jgi:hypothetical protein
LAFADPFLAKTLAAAGTVAVVLVMGAFALAVLLMGGRGLSSGDELKLTLTPPPGEETTMLIEGADGWTTYRNTAFGYEFRFPTACATDSILTTPPAPIVFQRTTARCVTTSGQSVSIEVTANLQGDWCISGRPQDSRAIVVSGVAGREDICYGQPNRCTPQPDCLQTIYRITRSFDNVEGQPNYVIRANDAGADLKPEDDPLMRRIVESFQFLN